MESHPVRGAWIEISISVLVIGFILRSHPVRGAWIEIFLDYTCGCFNGIMSHPVRGAWIEIGSDGTL